MGSTPLCTVAIPVYHRMNKGLAFAAIESALAQRRDDVEIVVVDDHTTDGTWAALERFRDAPVRLVRNDRNLGLFANFNRCLDEARGRFVRILCSDDVLEPGTLADELAAMERHPDMALLTTRGLRIAPDGSVLGVQAAALPEGYYRGDHAIAAVLRANAATGYNSLNYPSGILLRKTSADAAGRFGTEMRMVGDMEYFLRVLEVGALGVLNRIGCRITVHADQEGSRLALEPLVMQELFTLADSFQEHVPDRTSRRRVRGGTAGLSAWQAVRAAMRGHVRRAGEHLAVARRNGASALGLATGIGGLAVHRIRWTLRGPFVPGDVRPDGPL
jgi:glycosyltransferase involved in cell wall biosynthesis